MFLTSKSRSLTLISALGVTLAISLLLFRSGSTPSAYAMDQDTVALDEKSKSSLPKVTVSSVKVGNYQPEIIGFGEVKPVHDLKLSSEVTGRVDMISTNFEVGKIIREGTVIARLDQTNYIQALASAQVKLAQAELELLEEERQGKQAENEWHRSGIGGTPNSQLVLRLPQLALAQAKVSSAMADVRKAQRDLDNTIIRVPFTSVVVSREIQPGSVIQVGSLIATLYSTHKVEIRIPLSNEQWTKIPSDVSIKPLKSKVLLMSASGSATWEGLIERTEKHLVQDTRQRAIVISVKNPLEHEIPLYPGTFVKANIKGRLLDNIWEIPLTALSQRGDIWFVEENGVLKRSKAHQLFEIGEHSYVVPLEIGDTARRQIVKRPLSYFREGMVVQISREVI